MATYYVDPVLGNDGWPGTPGQPWQTVNKAATTAVAGDTVIYQNGTYPLGVGQTTWNSGAAGNYITHRAANSRQAIWQRTAAGKLIQLQTDDDYLIFDGIYFDGNEGGAVTGWVGIQLSGCDYVTFTDCEVGNIEARCFYLEAGTTHITIEDCAVHQDHYEDGESNDGILTWGAGITDLTVTGCTFYNIDHVGIYITSCTDFLIENCEIYDTHSHLIQPGDPGAGHGWAVSGVIDRCDLHDSEGYGPADPEGHNGIYITGGDVDEITVQRCDLYRLDAHGIQVGANVAGPIHLLNNTIYSFNTSARADGSGIRLNDGSAGMGDVTVRNNAIYAVNAAGYMLNVSGANMNAAVVADYNDWYSGVGAATQFYRNGVTYASFALYQAAGYEAHSIDDDPTFTNPGADDFTLQVGSPCIDAGTNVGLPFYGSAPDMGAHEYQPPGPGGTVVHVVVVVAVVAVVVE